MKNKILFWVFAALITIGCKKEKTTWENEWSAPVINDTLNLLNLVNDSTIQVNELGYYELGLERTLIDLNISEFVEIPDTTLQEVFTIAVSNLTLSPGFSYINSTEEHNMNVPNGAQLGKIILNEGFIDVKVQNPIGTKTIFNVILPGVSKDGVTFSQQYVAPAGTNLNPGVVNTSINLAGYEIDLTGLSGSEWNTLRSQITVSTDPSGPTVTITDEDETKVDAKFRDVKIAYARGYFGQQTIADTSEFDLAALNVYGGGVLDLPNTSLEFEIENGLKVGGKGTLHFVSNENNQGSTVNLSSPQLGIAFNLDPATGHWESLSPSFKSIGFTSANSNIENYLENLGVKHKVSYTFQLNPWGNVSGGWDEIFPNSRLRVKLKADMPLTFNMDDLVLRDTFDVNLNQDPEKTRVTSGELILETRNGFPFEGAIKLVFLDQDNNVKFEVVPNNLVASSLYGTYDALSGVLVENSTVNFVLTQAMVDKINEIKSIVVQVNMNTPNPVNGISEPVQIPAGAFIGIRLRTKFVTEIVL